MSQARFESLSQAVQLLEDSAALADMHQREQFRVLVTAVADKLAQSPETTVVHYQSVCKIVEAAKLENDKFYFELLHGFQVAKCQHFEYAKFVFLSACDKRMATPAVWREFFKCMKYAKSDDFVFVLDTLSKYRLSNPDNWARQGFYVLSMAANNAPKFDKAAIELFTRLESLRPKRFPKNAERDAGSGRYVVNLKHVPYSISYFWLTRFIAQYQFKDSKPVQLTVITGVNRNQKGEVFSSGSSDALVTLAAQFGEAFEVKSGVTIAQVRIYPEAARKLLAGLKSEEVEIAVQQKVQVMQKTPETKSLKKHTSCPSCLFTRKTAIATAAVGIVASLVFTVL